MAVVIPLKLVYTPVDAAVTAIHNYQVPSTKVDATKEAEETATAAAAAAAADALSAPEEAQV